MKLHCPALALALTLAAAFPAATPTRAADTPAAMPAKFPSTYFDWNRLEVKPTGVGSRRDVYNAPTGTLQRFECHISTLLPGHISHPPHHHPQEEMIVLQEGTLDVYINGQKHRVGPGSVFFFASNDVHNVTSIGPGPATYLVFNFTTAGTHTVPSKPAVEFETATQLHSSVFDWDQLAVTPAAYGTRRVIADAPTVTLGRFEMHATTLNPGQESPHGRHNHLDEGFLIVKDGTPDVLLNGVAHRATPGSIAFLGTDQPLKIENNGATPVTYYVAHFTTEATPKSLAAN